MFTCSTFYITSNFYRSTYLLRLHISPVGGRTCWASKCCHLCRHFVLNLLIESSLALASECTYATAFRGWIIILFLFRFYFLFFLVSLLHASFFLDWVAYPSTRQIWLFPFSTKALWCRVSVLALPFRYTQKPLILLHIILVTLAGPVRTYCIIFS